MKEIIDSFIAIAILVGIFASMFLIDPFVPFVVSLLFNIYEYSTREGEHPVDKIWRVERQKNTLYLFLGGLFLYGLFWQTPKHLRTRKYLFTEINNTRNFINKPHIDSTTTIHLFASMK